MLVTAVAGVIGVVPTRPAGAAIEQVEMAKMRFNPARLQIQMGDTVVWEAGDDGHTVTARDGTFDSSTRGTMAEGDQFRWRFRVPGTYAYFCRVHQSRGMQGEIVVVDPSAATSTTRLTPVTAAATTSTTVRGDDRDDAAGHDHQPAAGHELDDQPEADHQHHVPAGEPVVPQEPPALNPNAAGPDRLGHCRAARRPGRRPSLGRGEGRPRPGHRARRRRRDCWWRPAVERPYAPAAAGRRSPAG